MFDVTADSPCIWLIKKAGKTVIVTDEIRDANPTRALSGRMGSARFVRFYVRSTPGI